MLLPLNSSFTGFHPNKDLLTGSRIKVKKKKKKKVFLILDKPWNQDPPPSQSADLHTNPSAARPISSPKQRVSRVRATGRQAEEGRRRSAGKASKDRVSLLLPCRSTSVASEQEDLVLTGFKVWIPFPWSWEIVTRLQATPDLFSARFFHKPRPLLPSSSTQSYFALNQSMHYC